MIFVIMSYGGHRNQEGRHWSGKAVAFTVGATVSGGSLGALLGGVLGAAVPATPRVGLVALVGFMAVLAGALALSPFQLRPPQFDRETAQRWMTRGALSGAVLNGVALGAGFTTRIGFWLWYLIPSAAFLTGTAWAGALVYGTYGLARGLGPWALVAARALERSRGLDFEEVGDWLVARIRPLRVAGAAEAIVLGVALVVVAGP